MIIDSDDEQAAPEPAIARPTVQFEDEETELESSQPYEAIIRYIDVPLGVQVLDVAVPLFLPDTQRSSLDPFPDILNSRILVSSICADSSTRIVSVPLIPPHPTNNDVATWDIHSVTINGSIRHHEIPMGIAMTFTGRQQEESEAEGRTSRSQTQTTRSGAGSTDQKSAQRWDILVATHATDASGALLIHRIPIEAKIRESETSFVFSDQSVYPTQKYALSGPVKRISFNPFPYPSERHANLLVAFSSGKVKLFSCLSPVSKPRNSSSSPDRGPGESEGKWLITLYPGFEPSTSDITRRKAVVDAAWILGGRAVIVLLEDGEWGIWDIEGAGPGADHGPLRGQGSTHGVTGASLTLFSVSGRITNTTQSGKSQGSASNPEPRAKFAPMTPSTRRIREDTFFKGSQGGPSLSSMSGEISVMQTNSSRDALPDEVVLIRHGDQSALIPSLLSLWRNAVRSTGTFDASSRCRVANLSNVNLLGERMIGISHLPAASRKERENSSHREFDALITTEHALIILAPQLTGLQTVSHPALTSTTPSFSESDQLRLTRGELDVEGMDRVLSGMSGVIRQPSLQSPMKRSRIFS
jgi:hypothetical protein